MAIEAARQLTQESPKTANGYSLHNIRILRPIDLTASSGAVEVQTSLHMIEQTGEESISYRFTIRTYTDEDDEVVNCLGYITVELAQATRGWEVEKGGFQRRKLSETLSASTAHRTVPINSQHMYSFLSRQCGFDYGPSFQVAQHQHYDESHLRVSANVRLSEANDDHVIHPITLDAFFHLPLTVITSGGSHSTATSVPTHLKYLWVAASSLALSAKQQTVTAFATITDTTQRGFTCTGIGISNADSHDVCLWYDGLKLTNITTHPASTVALPNPEQIFLNVDCKISLDKLEPSELCELLDSRHLEESEPSEFFRDLGLLVEVSLDQFLRCANLSASDSQHPWKPHFWNWVQHHCSDDRRRERWDNPESEIREAAENFSALVNRVESCNAIGRLYSAVASNLIAFWTGTADPLEFLMNTNLLKECYKFWNNHVCARQICEYMDLLSHQNPGMNILEIGGGTGSGTRNLVASLCTRPGDHEGLLWCNRYDFTDVSASFLPQAKEEFAPFLSQKTFGILDIERDWVQQHYASGFYDVVLAVSVIHISTDLQATLQRARRALKPNGKLIMQEAFTPSGWTLSYVFGLFPGWWSGVGDGRVLSPSISINDWDALLKANGFSGVDIVRDPRENGTLHYGWIISTAIEESLSAPQPKANHDLPISIFFDERVPQQASYADMVVSSLKRWPSAHISSRSIQPFSDVVNYRTRPEELIIFLADYGQFYLKSLDASAWGVLKHLIRTSRRFLWATTGGGRLAHPNHAMLDGLARTLRLEHEELHLVTLALETIGSTERQVSHLTRIVEEMFLKPSYQTYEQEYVEIDGFLHTRRIVEAIYLKSAVDARVTPFITIPKRQDSNTPFAATMKTAGNLQFPCYVEIPDPFKEPPDHNLVDVSVKAVALQRLDHPHNLDQKEKHGPGRFFAGVVVRSDTTSHFHPGDHVFGVHPGALRSHVTLSPRSLTGVPSGTAFSDVCSIMPPFAIAFTALNEIGHVTSTDSVLIQGGTSAIGLAAIHVLIQQDVKDIWVTAEDKNAGRLFSEQMHIPEERILSKVWVDAFHMSSSQWRHRFDVVFSAQDMSPPILSLNHVRLGGRYITLHPKSVSNRNEGSQQILDMPAGVTLSFIDPETMSLSQDSLCFAAGMIGSQRSTIAGRPAEPFSASRLQEAYHVLQSLKTGEYAVILFDENETLNVSKGL